MADVLVLSIAIGAFRSIFNKCIVSQEEYCRRNGYKYVLVERSPRPLRPDESSWLKLPLMLEGLRAGYDLVMFVDADVEIRPHTPELAGYLAGKPGSLFMAHGHSGRINAGLIIARQSAGAEAFLQQIIDSADLSVPREDRAPYENGHVIFYGKSNTEVFLLEHSEWNNNSKFDPNSFVQHYASGPLRDFWLKHHAPFLVSIAPRIRRFLKKRGIQIPRRTGTSSILKSLEELTPFYTMSYGDLIRRR